MLHHEARIVNRFAEKNVASLREKKQIPTIWQGIAECLGIAGIL
jgi:hypothetical protein